jgi:hypothetical protein
MIKPDMQVCEQEIIKQFSDYLRNARLFVGDYSHIRRFHYYDLPDLQPNNDFNDFGNILHNLYDGTYEYGFNDEESYSSYYSALHGISEDVLYQEAEKLNIPENADEDERDYLFEELEETLDGMICELID